MSDNVFRRIQICLYIAQEYTLAAKNVGFLCFEVAENQKRIAQLKPDVIKTNF